MSYIPDVRNRFRERLYEGTRGASKMDKNERNPYWEGYLNDTDKEYVRGYDWNTEQVVSSFFQNLDVFADILDFIDTDDIDIEEVVSERSILEYSDEELAEKSESTLIAKKMRECLLEWIEMERNELIVSMIDGMKEDEYDRMVKKADKGASEPKKKTNIIKKRW